VKFAECMRENGVMEFPDPDASGEFAYGIERGSALDPSTAEWKKAIGACKDLQPPGALGDAKQSAEEKEAGLKFAQCMRENGVKEVGGREPRQPGQCVYLRLRGRSAPTRNALGGAAGFSDQEVDRPPAAP
jgi:hypothetical protein